MSLKFILVDYQNIQNLAGLKQLGESVVCEMFIGPKQTISPKQFEAFKYATTRWHVVRHPGKNAADFQIVFRLRELLYEFDEFYVLSKDKGFDSVVDLVLTDERFAGKRIKRIENLSEANFHKN